MILWRRLSPVVLLGLACWMLPSCAVKVRAFGESKDNTATSGGGQNGPDASSGGNSGRGNGGTANMGGGSGMIASGGGAGVAGADGGPEGGGTVCDPSQPGCEGNRAT